MIEALEKYSWTDAMAAGETWSRQGQHDNARWCFEWALRIAELRHKAARMVQYSSALLGLALEELGDLDGAETRVKDALRALRRQMRDAREIGERERHFEERHYYRLTLARIYYRQINLLACEHVLERALRQAEAHWPPGHKELTMCRDLLASCRQILEAREK